MYSNCHTAVTSKQEKGRTKRGRFPRGHVERYRQSRNSCSVGQDGQYTTKGRMCDHYKVQGPFV